MRLFLVTFGILLFFLEAMLGQSSGIELRAEVSKNSMTKKILEEQFDNIRRRRKQNKFISYFNLSESLELDSSLRGLKCLPDEKRAYFLDYIGLLKKLPVDQRIEVLRYCMSQENAKYRGLYCYYLAQTKDPNSLDEIIRLKQTKEKEYVVSALQYYDHLRALASLVDTLLNDKSPKIRYIAAGCLGSIGNEGAIPFLISALSDDKSIEVMHSQLAGLPNETVATAALRALNKITNKNLSIEEWKKIDFEILQKE